MRNLALLLIFCLLSIGSYAQSKIIKLNAPDKSRGVSIMKAFELRSSDREFQNKELNLQDISDLLWAANGINRPATGKRTAPSAMNKQDIDIYICMAKGAYRYDPEQNELHLITTGDLRPAVAGGQAWVTTAPVSLILVSDIAKFSGDQQQRMLAGAMDAGIVSQNIALFCAGVGLATVPRMSMDQARLKTALKLGSEQIPMLNNPVGYKKN